VDVVGDDIKSVKIGDFGTYIFLPFSSFHINNNLGVSKILALQDPGTILGTPGFIAPEMINKTAQSTKIDGIYCTTTHKYN
jgi:serine/threonine protein kinase